MQDISKENEGERIVREKAEGTLTYSQANQLGGWGA